MRKAIEHNPEDSIAYSNLGGILKDQSKLNDAELFIRKAIELNPNDSIAHSNLGSLLRDLNKLEEAELYTRKAIELNPKDSIAYSNLGSIYRGLGKLEEGKLYTRKAIELNPNDSIAHSNLGGIYTDLGISDQAEKSLLKAIEINPNLAKAYYNLSTLYKKNKQANWEGYLFSKNILKKQNNINLIDIYFAQGNILEKKLQYTKSANIFMKANKLNRKIYGSNYIHIKNRMEYYYKIWKNIKSEQDQPKNHATSIFIVGLPRSGKTITESILSCSKSLLQFGENNYLSKAVDKYLNPKVVSNNQNLYQLYLENIPREISNKSYICSTTPGNFQYTGIIASQIEKSKVIYCFRNPLDHIKEMFCSHMGRRFSFKTSIVESAKILLSINKLMEDYKSIYDSKIYFLNYDKLVVDPENEIKSLLSWIGLKYETKYLYPHLDPSTSIVANDTSSVINTKYLNSWKNYKKLLQPAIEIISSNEEYKYLIT